MKDNSGLKKCQERVNYLCGIEYLCDLTHSSSLLHFLTETPNEFYLFQFLNIGIEIVFFLTC